MHRPYSLLRGLLAENLHITETDPLAEVWQKFEAGLAAQGLAPAVAQVRAHFIGQLLGYDFNASPHLAAARTDARQVHDRALLYLADFLRAAARPAGCTIFLDDIHWGDDSSLDMLAYLFRALADQPLLVICLARPTLLERRPTWGQTPQHSLLRLEPLSRAASQRLVDEILQASESLPPTLHDLILNNAEGNPYYIEELIKMLMEDGLLLRQEGRLEATVSSLQAARIPPTLTGILQARMDSLPGEQRAVLQRSSVVGRTFWDETVSSLSDSAQVPASITDLERSLDALQQRELILPHAQAIFSGTREFAFKHAILHDVTYESVLKRDRRRYHAHIAAWLIDRCGQRAREYSGLIADHLEKAGQPQKALPYLRLAGEQARQTLANREAVGYFSRALEYEKDPAARFDLLLAREQLYDLQGQREAQQQDLAALETLAQALGLAPQARVAQRQSNLALVTSDYPAARQAAQRALALAQECQDAALQAAAHFSLGQSNWRMRSYNEAIQHLQQALPLAQASRQAEVEADVLRMMGNILHDQGIYTEAAGYFDQSLAICRRLNHRSGQSAALNVLGILHRAQGNIAASLDCYQQALALAQEIGDRRMESGILVNLGVLYRNQMDYERAI
jgi:tetratricopeptide (TPR) repeat protein